VSVRSLGPLATRRRTAAGQPLTAAAAAQPGDGATEADGLGTLEQAVPTEMIAFYTAIVAACETVLARSPHSAFTPFRLTVYLVGLAATAFVAWRAVLPAVGSWRGVLRSPEWWTATLSFAGWGAAVPGSFLYTWLGPNPLTITVATITAGVTLVISTLLAPRLKGKEQPFESAPPGGLALIPLPPANR
jgi:hypothetical protein